MSKKEYIFLLVCLICGIISSRAQSVYCINFKDGSNQILWTDMVDSMRVVKSNPDLSRDTYDTQEIIMNDTVYRFPLSSIERITFKTPENVYKEDIVRLDNPSLRPYIVGSVGQSFSLKANTPAYLVPNIGDKVVTTECSDLFPRGFIGKVLSIEDIDGVKQLNCEDLYLHEVFDYYFGTISEAVPKRTEGIQRANEDNKCGDRINPFNQYDILWDPAEPYLFNVAPHLPIRNFSYGATSGIVTGTWGFQIDEFRWETLLWPHISIRTTIVVTPQDWLYGCVSVHGDIDVNNVIDMKGSMYEEMRIHNPQAPSFNIGINDHNYKFDLTEVVKQPFYIPEFETGFFVRPSIEAAIKTNTTSNYRLDGIFNFSWHGEPPLKNIFSLKPQPDKEITELEGLYFKGVLNFGLYLDLKFNIKKLFVQLGLETGGRFEANVAIERNDNEKFYSTKRFEMLSKSNVSLTPYTHVYWNPGVNIGDIFDFPIPGNNWTKEGYPLFERIVVPVFGNIYAGRLQKRSSDILARVNISGHCIMPWNVGFAAVDEAENVTYKYYDIPYQYLPDGGSITLTLENLNPLKKYKIYPVIKYDEIEMFAPGIDIDVKTKVETLSATIKENTAILSGKASGDLNSSSLKVGFSYGKSETSMSKVYTELLSDGSFKYGLEDLEFGTDYLYRSFVEFDQECIFGDVKYFQTDVDKSQENPIIETLNPIIKGNKVILKGRTNINNVEHAASFILYNEINQYYKIIQCNVAEDGIFYSDEVSLLYNSDFSYQAFISTPSMDMYGEKMGHPIFRVMGPAKQVCGAAFFNRRSA